MDFSVSHGLRGSTSRGGSPTFWFLPTARGDTDRIGVVGIIGPSIGLLLFVLLLGFVETTLFTHASHARQLLFYFLCLLLLSCNLLFQLFVTENLE